MKLISFVIITTLASATLTDLLDTQNAIRTLYRRQPMEWSEDLATDAQQWAEVQLERAPSGLGHSDGVAQNIAWSTGVQWPEEKAACHWLISEGHRSTMLSNEVKRVGCGVARGDHGTAIVCNYEPYPTIYETTQTSICNKIIHY